MHSPLIALVCGYERGGTTVVSEILRQHPQIDSGHEGGFLLGESPTEFVSLEPYTRSLQVSWGVSDKDLDIICSSHNWEEVYSRLLDKSTKVQSEFIFDKTPRYMKELPEVMSKVDVPCVVIVRDPRSLFYSWAKRFSGSIQDWRELALRGAILRYRQYAAGYLNALSCYSDRILLVQYEDLCTNPGENARKIFDMIGFDFHESYTSFSRPWHNIHGNNVCSDYVFEYRDHFDDKMCEEITRELSDFDSWFWD